MRGLHWHSQWITQSLIARVMVLSGLLVFAKRLEWVACHSPAFHWGRSRRPESGCSSIVRQSLACADSESDGQTTPARIPSESVVLSARRLSRRRPQLPIRSYQDPTPDRIAFLLWRSKAPNLALLLQSTEFQTARSTFFLAAGIPNPPQSARVIQGNSSGR